MLRANISLATSPALTGKRTPLFRAPLIDVAASTSTGRAPVFSPSPCTASSKRSVVILKASAASPSGDTHAGHAFLHDFCMGLPYGAIACILGCILLFLVPDKTVGGSIFGSGALVLGSSVLSLKTWKKGGSSTFLTLLASAASGIAGYLSWMKVQAGASTATGGVVAYWLSAAIIALSAAFTLFGTYNVIAGGNPPPNPPSSTE